MRFSQYFQNLLPLGLPASGSAIPRDTIDLDNSEASDPTTRPKSLNRPPRPDNPFAAGLNTAPSSCRDFMKPSEQCITDLQAQPGAVTAFSGGEMKWDSDYESDDKQQAMCQTAAWDAITLARFADQEPDPHNVHYITLWKTWMGPDCSTQQKRIAGPQGLLPYLEGWQEFWWLRMDLQGMVWIQYKIDQIEEELTNGNTEKERKAEWQKNAGQMILHKMMHLDSALKVIDGVQARTAVYFPVAQASARRFFNLNQEGSVTRANTNVDSYAWLAKSKYCYDLTGYFPAPPNYKAIDDSLSAEELDGFVLDFSLITEGTQDTEIESRLNNVVSRFGTPPSALAPKPRKPLSITMVSNVNSHAVKSCGETEGEKLTPEEGSADVELLPDVAGNTKNLPWPGGSFKLNIEGDEYEDKSDSTNPGRLFCPKKEISCAEDSVKSKKVRSLKCGDRVFFHAVVYCDF
ncbi:hypothetical protein CC78DRAFT_585532 [Lojkania enalia]|uniref:Uncharacterized protein n=1 Tax=Lojkania enalia TaxID=147567 RepID=A0A9P4MYY6_9PLEO|nr:hypothetical protein CC78DRAFT_585532 [Didymosphaeria enalia]